MPDALAITPGPLAMDTAGNLFLADTGKLWRIDAGTGNLTRIAGGENAQPLTEGLPAGRASGSWNGLATDTAGNLYMTGGGDIWRICGDGYECTYGSVYRVPRGGTSVVNIVGYL